MNSKIKHLSLCLLKAFFLLTVQYLEFCDQIILLENGKICENGTHSELMQKKGKYAQLIQKMHKEAISVSPAPPPSLPIVDARALRACALSPGHVAGHSKDSREATGRKSGSGRLLGRVSQRKCW